MPIFTLGAMSLAGPADSKPVNDLGWALYRSQAPAANLFLSPIGVYEALSLTFEGSQGETRAQARRFLGLTAGEGPFRAGSQLDSSLKMPGIQLARANSLWMNSKGPGIRAPAEPFVSLVEKEYGAAVRFLDFRSAQHIAGLINSWCDEQTHHLIRDLLAPQDLAGVHVAVMNAVHFKGLWSWPFDKKKTHERVFNAPNGPAKTLFLRQTGRFAYFENKDMQMMDLPYQGERIAMSIVLPRPGRTLEAIEKSLSPAIFASWSSQSRERRVQVEIPKLWMSWGAKNLSEALVRLGMPVQGDFSALGAPKMGIQAVLHKAVLNVDEDGTEAAAATAVMAPTGGPPEPPADFIADRPFFFVIRDVATGAWLFAGRLARP